MVLSKGVLIKGIASVGAAGVAVGGYVGRDHIAGFFRGPSILDKAGVKCNEKGCVLGKDKRIIIRQGDASSDKEVNSLSSVSTRAKIILQKLTGRNDYNEGLKFTVEEGDIILKKASPSIVMEKTESYELKEENGKFILSRKSKSTMRRWDDLRTPKGCPEGADSALKLECTIGLPNNETISSIKEREKNKQQFPSAPYIKDLMKKSGISLPKDLEDLGRTTNDRLKWSLKPTKKNSTLYPKITKEELKALPSRKPQRSS